ncbi:hypothetical protein HY968_02175 [Candidatus Kaiserbacteria bacterium]|nr:hypothetical protein [Candidatus Kaiserbacteria bacterium]
MQHFRSPYGSILLTDERKRHILEFHPEVRMYLRYFVDTLAKPEYESRSVHDAAVVICYQYIPRRKRYLAIVVKTGTRPFILTAYLARKLKQDTL